MNNYKTIITVCDRNGESTTILTEGLKCDCQNVLLKHYYKLKMKLPINVQVKLNDDCMHAKIDGNYSTYILRVIPA